MPFCPKSGGVAGKEKRETKDTQLLEEFDFVVKIKDKWLGLNASGEVFTSNVPLRQKIEGNDNKLMAMAEAMYDLAFDDGYMKAKQEQRDYLI